MPNTAVIQTDAYRTVGQNLTVAALGVVYGDIGTSPLYTVRQCFPDLTSVSEPRVFGEKSVARVDGTCPTLARGSDNRLDVKITLIHSGRTDADRFVGEMHRERLLIGIAEHRDGAQIEFLCRADDPNRDFTTIGDQ